MSKTKFYVDEKISVWRRSWYSSDKEMTTQEIIESVKVNSDDLDLDFSEILDETEEHVSPANNNEFATTEIFDESGKSIWVNGNI